MRGKGRPKKIPPPYIESVERAKEEGYGSFWGKPCVKGHPGLRMTQKGNRCVHCKWASYDPVSDAKPTKVIEPKPKPRPKLITQIEVLPTPIPTARVYHPPQKPTKWMEGWSEIAKYNWRHRHEYQYKYVERGTFPPSPQNRVINFIQRRCYHIEGELSGEPFLLERWQYKAIRRAFGWIRRSDGSRRFKVLYIEIPRKNGKSALASALSAYLTYGDQEPGARVVVAASDKEQAGIVFDLTKKMIEASPKMSKDLNVFRGSVVHYPSHSSLVVISSEARTKHGKNLHGLILDEVHAQTNRELYDVLHTATSARRQPMEVLLTTAGYDKNSICWELHDYAEKIRQGIVEDPSFLGIIFAATPDDDWKIPATWYKANPNLGVSKKLEYMRQECERAIKSPGYENTFKRLELNIWTEQDSRWLSIDAWDVCGTATDEDLRGQSCYGGMDLASTEDIAAFVLKFPQKDGRIISKEWYWIPKETAEKRAKEHRVPYPQWIKEGHIKATEGNRIDYDVIEKDIILLSETYQIEEVGFDQWNAIHLAGRLDDHGIKMVPVAQTHKGLGAATKEMERIITNKKLSHSANPVTRWMVKNVAIVQNAEGEIKPSKKKSKEKIDGVVCYVMALDRTMRSTVEESPYETQGIMRI